MKGSKLPAKDKEDDYEKELRIINVNLKVHASNDVNQGDLPKISSEERSCIENLKETKVPKNCICLDIEIFSPKKGWVNLIE